MCPLAKEKPNAPMKTVKVPIKIEVLPKTFSTQVRDKFNQRKKGKNQKTGVKIN